MADTTDLAGKIGSLPFRFENFGTFAGPQYLSKNYDYDLSSIEGAWPTLVPGDFSFTNTDIGMFLFNNELNYVGYHCQSVSTANVTLEASYGAIPNLKNIVKNTTNIGLFTNVGAVAVKGAIAATVSVSAPRFDGAIFTGRALGNKSFDIPHATQPGKRIRHVCVEGPEAAIYVRGRLTGKNVIELPDYWDGLIDPETITVSLTQIGSSQDLIVESVDWGKVVKIRSGNASNINCFYEVWAARYINRNTPEEKLHVVYDGESPADYPGNNDDFIVGGFQ